MNTAEYWADVRERAEELEQSHPEGVPLVLRNRQLTAPTRVTVCPPGTAAKCLVDGTHLIATESDIAASAVHDGAAGRRLRALQQKRNPFRTIFQIEAKR